MRGGGRGGRGGAGAGHHGRGAARGGQRGGGARGGGARGGGGHFKGPFAGKGGPKPHFHSKYTVVVTGFPKNSTAQALNDELVKNARTPFTATNFNMSKNSPVLFFNFDDPARAVGLLELDGLLFHGQKLSIREKSSGPVEDTTLTAEQKEKLVKIVSLRYDASNSYLNLDQIVLDTQMTFSDKRFVNSLLQIIRENCSDVVSISFGRNKITSLVYFKDLNTAAPHLENLSFETNLIEHLQEINHLQEMQYLQQLVFIDNPIMLNPGYFPLLLFKFPGLLLIDKSPDFPRFIKLNLPDQTISGSLPPAGDSFYMNDDCEKFALDFVPKFLELYDNENRGNLLIDLFLDQSQFSISVGGKSDETIPGYSQTDRNLWKLGEFDVNINAFVYSGKLNIALMLKSMPRTQHILDECILDVIYVSSCATLCVTIHGYYQEEVQLPDGKTSIVVRAFHRNLTLVAANGANAFNCFILNDQLQVSIPDVPKVVVQAPAMTEDQKKMLAMQISQYCSVSVEVAANFLSQHNWDANLAAKAIMEYK